jgi:hypothetical protein
MRLLIATAMFMLSACATDLAPHAATYKSGEEISLQVGQSAPVDGRWIISFAGVTEDSRCPMNARCAWEGNARIALTIREISPASSAGRPYKPMRFELNTSEKLGTAQLRLSAVIELRRLEPTPMTGVPIRDYVATLVVKAGK